MRIDLEAADLRPLVQQVVSEVLARQDAIRTGDRIAYPEAEAAMLIGVPRHVLRDCRLRGEVEAVKVGAKWVYERGVLVAWLSGRH